MKRQGMVAIYELFGRGRVLYGYEVIIVKVLPAEIIVGRDYPEREAYPSSAKNSEERSRRFAVPQRLRMFSCLVL